MHIPDGFINGGTAAAAAVVAAGGIGISLRATGRYLQERQIPLAGLLAAFIFVLQMLNFPVAAGTSGHLIGAALAAVAVGPALAVVVMAVVVIVQALLFADGGITALGLNLVNMAVIAPLAGWYAARAAGAIFPARRWAVLAAAFVAAWLSVVAASVGFVAEYALGGAGAVDLGAVFWAMVGVHAVIGIGEGLITVAIVSAVVATRPDLVRIARTLQPAHPVAGRSRRRVIGVVVAGLAIAVALAWVVAPLASGDPDGLERVAIDQGFADAATDSPVAGSPLAEYEVDGVAGEQAGTGISGTAGIVAVFAAGVVLIGGARWVVLRGRASKPA